LLYFWINLFGEAEPLVRLPSLLGGISSIVLTYEIAKEYCSPRAALLVGLLLCLSPAHVWYSQDATPYAVPLFFYLTTVLAWLRLREMPSRKGWYAVYLGAFLATVFAHYDAAVLLLPLTLLSLTLERPLRRRIIVAHAVVVLSLALALSTKYMYGQVKTGLEFLRSFTLFEWWMLFFNWFLQGNVLWTVSPYRADLGYLLRAPVFLACQVFFMILFVRGLLPRQEQKTWMQTWELSLFVCSFPLIMLLMTAAGYQPLYIERYLLPVLPFFLIALVRGATSFSHPRAVLACSLAAGAIGVASYGALLFKSDKWTVYKQNPDWRSAARYLGAQSIPPKQSVILATISPVELVYYFPREGNAPYPKTMLYNAKLVEFMLASNRMKAFYLLRNNYWVAGVDEVLQRLKDDKRLELTNAQSFKGLEIYTFTRQGAVVD
jgi:mannosyltransferase